MSPAPQGGGQGDLGPFASPGGSPHTRGPGLQRGGGFAEVGKRLRDGVGGLGRGRRRIQGCWVGEEGLGVPLSSGPSAESAVWVWSQCRKCGEGSEGGRKVGGEHRRQLVEDPQLHPHPLCFSCCPCEQRQTLKIVTKSSPSPNVYTSASCKTPDLCLSTESHKKKKRKKYSLHHSSQIKTRPCFSTLK